MIHAVLIMAHKNVEHVCRIARYFTKNCEVYVHFDKKSKLEDGELTRLKSLPQVKLVTSKYDVNWGGYSVLECELWLLAEVLQQGKADYFHLISGQDYPIRPLEQFLSFFEEHAGKEFLTYNHLPHSHWEGNTFRRLQYYYPYDWAGNWRNPRRWVWEQVSKQIEQGMKRPMPQEFDHLYGGSQWFSITRKAAQTLIDYTRHQPSLYRRMWMTFAPEECYVATVLVNLLGEEDIVPTNLRYIRWKKENGNRPANLGGEHFASLLYYTCFFARKFEKSISDDLLQQVDEYLLKDREIKQLPNGGWDYDGVLAYGYDEKFCNLISQLYMDISAESAADIGCGAGLYVAQYKERNLNFVGYDANPYTPQLSQMLIPDSDDLCQICDITHDKPQRSFDLVVCKDVLPYIPKKALSEAARHLMAVSKHIIVLYWKGTGQAAKLSKQNLTMEEIRALFGGEFSVENFLTARMRIRLMENDCCVLIRRGTQILESFVEQGD